MNPGQMTMFITGDNQALGFSLMSLFSKSLGQKSLDLPYLMIPNFK